jgi:flagellar basal body-associated protein FliL
MGLNAWVIVVICIVILAAVGAGIGAFVFLSGSKNKMPKSLSSLIPKTSKRAVF